MKTLPCCGPAPIIVLQQETLPRHRLELIAFSSACKGLAESTGTLVRTWSNKKPLERRLGLDLPHVLSQLAPHPGTG